LVETVLNARLVFVSRVGKQCMTRKDAVTISELHLNHKKENGSSRNHEIESYSSILASTLHHAWEIIWVEFSISNVDSVSPWVTTGPLIYQLSYALRYLNTSPSRKKCNLKISRNAIYYMVWTGCR
jgi:hypothetical protein